MKEKLSYDWFGFWVYFLFGGMFGAYLGLRLLSHSPYATSTSTISFVLFVGGGAWLGGLPAGLLHEDDGWR